MTNTHLLAADRLTGFSNEEEKMTEEKDSLLGSMWRTPGVWVVGPGGVMGRLAQEPSEADSSHGWRCACEANGARSAQPSG